MNTVDIIKEAALWLHAAYDRPPQTPEAVAMLANIDALHAIEAGLDSWEANAQHMLDRCPYTVWQRPGGGPVDLKATLIVTFMGMVMRLQGHPMFKDEAEARHHRFGVTLDELISAPLGSTLWLGSVAFILEGEEAMSLGTYGDNVYLTKADSPGFANPSLPSDTQAEYMAKWQHVRSSADNCGSAFHSRAELIALIKSGEYVVQ